MIKSKKLTFSYDEDVCALADVNIKIAAGEFVAILGHNGSGKSTLARHLNALLTPSSGTLWVNGLVTSNPENTWEIRRVAGMVFQNPDNQIVATTVEEDVAFGPENLGVEPQEIRERVAETLATVGMSDFANRQPHHLSGGQKQRVAIAGVLAMRPSCIVLDEPSAMLDPSGRREVMQTITRLNREAGITVILITHFMEEAARAGRVIVMDAGRVVLDDVPRAIFADVEKMRGFGLGVPQVTSLAHELRSRGISMKKDIISTEEFLAEWCAVRGAHPQFRVRGEEATHSLEAESASPPPAPILELKSLTHTYSANSIFEKTAIDDISLKIHRGEMLAIIGHTGSGKSTLIQHFNALLKPTSGEIFLDGEPVADKSRLKEIRRRVGLVFQYPEHQLFEVSVYKDVAFGPTKMGLSEDEVKKNTTDALAAVGLGEEFYEKSPFELSGGQKRRAAIAGVLAMRPELLVLDEPAAGLDPRGKEEIFAQIRKMHAELGIAVIIVSHNMDDAAQLAERVLVMNGGRIVMDGAPEEVFTHAEFLKEIGLETPQISRLMMRLAEENPAIPTRIFTVEDAANALMGGAP